MEEEGTVRTRNRKQPSNPQWPGTIWRQWLFGEVSKGFQKRSEFQLATTSEPYPLSSYFSTLSGTCCLVLHVSVWLELQFASYSTILEDGLRTFWKKLSRPSTTLILTPTTLLRGWWTSWRFLFQLRLSRRFPRQFCVDNKKQFLMFWNSFVFGEYIIK